MDSLEPEVISRALHVIAVCGALLSVAVGFALFDEYKARRQRSDAQPKTTVVQDPAAEAAREAGQIDRVA